MNLRQRSINPSSAKLPFGREVERAEASDPVGPPFSTSNPTRGWRRISRLLMLGMLGVTGCAQTTVIYPFMECDVPQDCYDWDQQVQDPVGGEVEDWECDDDHFCFQTTSG